MTVLFTIVDRGCFSKWESIIIIPKIFDFSSAHLNMVFFQSHLLFISWRYRDVWSKWRILNNIKLTHNFKYISNLVQEIVFISNQWKIPINFGDVQLPSVCDIAFEKCTKSSMIMEWISANCSIVWVGRPYCMVGSRSIHSRCF